jgi:exopolysaccharide biosynthesis polyprenyl glycosylphosphotransferase
MSDSPGNVAASSVDQEPTRRRALARSRWRASGWRGAGPPAAPEGNDADGYAPRAFPLMDMALLASREATVPVPEATAARFRDLLDRHTAAHAVVVDRDAEAVQEVRSRERCYRRSLVVADVVAAYSAVWVAITLVGGGALRPLFLVIAPVIVLAAKLGGLYDRDELVLDHSTLNELPRLVNLATMLALVFWLARHYVVVGVPTTLDLLMLWVLLTAALVVARTLARLAARTLAPVERCLLIGRHNVFEQLQRRFEGYKGVGLIELVKPEDIAQDHTMLREIAERDNIHRIIIDTDATDASTTLETVRAANATGLQVSLVPSLLGAVGGSVVFDDIGGLVLMGVPRFGLSRSSHALKRAFDLSGATMVSILATPLVLILAIAIKLDARGPVLFSQTRVGRDGMPFRMFKFRTMIDGADRLKESLRSHNEADGIFKIEADPRITRVGRLLRRTGIDELPQLLNVLAGDMSLVGPRPLVLDEDSRVTGFDRHRLHLTPGITGRWQTLGAARVPLAEMVKIDYLYIANWSPWADFKIIVETVGYLARGRGQ